MNLDTYSWTGPIPRDVWQNRWLAYAIIEAEWSVKLRADGGRRLPGPIHMTPIHYGYIDGNSMEQVMLGKDSKLATYAMIRATGPALRPAANEVFK